jgi:predicted nucleic acid-binding Zn ribbon protein
MSFRQVGADLQVLLKEWMQNPESRQVLLQRTWERALGEKISRRCRPLRFNDAVLTVEVTDSSWADQLQSMSADLVSRINKALGGTWVRRIEWVDGEGEVLVSPRSLRSR